MPRCPKIVPKYFGPPEKAKPREGTGVIELPSRRDGFGTVP